MSSEAERNNVDMQEITIDGPDASIGGTLLTTEWTMAGIAGLILGLRIFAVAYILQHVRVADYLMLIAYVRRVFNLSSQTVPITFE